MTCQDSGSIGEFVASIADQVLSLQSLMFQNENYRQAFLKHTSGESFDEFLDLTAYPSYLLQRI